MTGPAHNARMTIITAGAALVAASLSIAPPAAQTAGDRLKEASRLEFEEGKRPDAAKLYRDVLAGDAANVEAHIGLGRVLTMDGNVAAGREHFEKALAAASATERNPVLSSLAISHLFEGNGAEAAKLYEQVFAAQAKADAFGPAANTANALARALLETGDLDGALKWYRTGYETAARIRDRTPADVDLWEMRWHHAQGRIAARRKQFDAARTHLQAVEALFAKGTLPEQQRAFLPQLAGYVAFYQGQYDAAIAELAKSDQNDPFVLALLAQAWEQKSDAAKAKELYGRVLTRPGYSLQLALTRPLARQKIAAMR
jgi:tetratricopeptide (TPR) repeat protein